MAPWNKDNLEAALRKNEWIIDTRSIDYGVQFELIEGVKVNLYDTGRLVVGGPKSDLKTKVEELVNASQPGPSRPSSATPHELRATEPTATLTRNFEKLARKAGITNIRLHDLRHFHATTLLRAGTHLKVVQERLGHASIAITADTYSHVAPDLQKQAVAAFADAMDSA